MNMINLHLNHAKITNFSFTTSPQKNRVHSRGLEILDGMCWWHLNVNLKKGHACIPKVPQENLRKSTQYNCQQLKKNDKLTQ